MRKIDCVLLIDDNDFDNFYHSVIIEKVDDSIQVKAVTDGEMALDYLASVKEDPENYPSPNLIFLDLNMPGMNGFEFLEKATEKKLLKVTGPLIVMLTSSQNPQDENFARKTFGDQIHDFRIKPLSNEMFREIMQSVQANGR